MFKVIERDNGNVYRAVVIAENDNYLFIMSPGLRKTTNRFNNDIVEKAISGVASKLFKRGYKGAKLRADEDFETVASVPTLEEAISLVEAKAPASLDEANPIDAALIDKFFSDEKLLANLHKSRIACKQTVDLLNVFTQLIKSISAKTGSLVAELNDAAKAYNVEGIKTADAKIQAVLKTFSSNEMLKAVMSIAEANATKPEDFDAEEFLGLK